MKLVGGQSHHGQYLLGDRADLPPSVHCLSVSFLRQGITNGLIGSGGGNPKATGSAIRFLSIARSWSTTFKISVSGHQLPF